MGSSLCFAHDPAAAEARRAARSKGGSHAHRHYPDAYASYDAAAVIEDAIRAVEERDAWMEDAIRAMQEEEDARMAPLVAECDRMDALLAEVMELHDLP